MTARALLALLTLAWSASASGSEIINGSLTGAELNVPTAPVVVVLAWDDFGSTQDKNYGASGAGISQDMPALDTLASEGTRFIRAYSNPLCAGARSSFVFGQHNFRTGVYGGPASGWPYERDSSMALVAGSAADTFASGKYGGNGGVGEVSGEDHPGWGAAQDGWDSFDLNNSPTLANLSTWERTYGNQASYALSPGDGTVNPNTETLTGVFIDTYNVDSAIAAYRSRDRGKPLILYVALHGIHDVSGNPYDPTAPFPTTSASCTSSNDVCYERMMEQMDLDSKRLLDALDLNHTHVFAFGDSGEARSSGCKGSLQECGIRVPFYAIGPGVSAGATFSDKVHLVDLWATALDIVAVTSYSGSSVVDGYSFADQIGWFNTLAGRDWASRSGHLVVAENGTDERAFYDDSYPDYKLIRDYTTGAVEFYDISAYNAGTGAEPSDICGGDGTCLGDLDAGQTTAFNGMCTELTTYEGGGAACPAP